MENDEKASAALDHPTFQYPKAAFFLVCDPD
jgi:hypothetical protein